MESIEEKLAKEISQAVEQIVAASHAAAISALDQAFRRTPAPAVHPNISHISQTNVVRRCPAELATLRETLRIAVCNSPGQTMLVLAKELGSTPRKLGLPMAGLKSERRVKSVGFRQKTRYFPLGE